MEVQSQLQAEGGSGGPETPLSVPLPGPGWARVSFNILRAGRGEGPGEEPLGALCLRAGKEDAAPGWELWAGAGRARHSCPGGSPCPAQALGLGGCPHQALPNSACLLCPGQVLEPFPL